MNNKIRDMLAEVEKDLWFVLLRIKMTF